MRLPEHDQRGPGAQAVEAHAANALGKRCHRKHAIVLRDLQPPGEALEGQLLQSRREGRELGHPGRARGHRDLDDPIRVGIGGRRLGFSVVAQDLQVGGSDG